jgi:hypothetical protein
MSADSSEIKKGQLSVCRLYGLYGPDYVTTQDFIKFWGKFFAFVLLEMFEISQGFKTFEPI